jgi:hypothetical protein
LCSIISKARILVQDDIAKVLEVELGKLVQLRKKKAANPIYDRDAEIKASIACFARISLLNYKAI